MPPGSVELSRGSCNNNYLGDWACRFAFRECQMDNGSYAQ